MSAPADGCRRLWLAVVLQAVHDVLAPVPRYVRSDDEAVMVRRRAEVWLASRDGVQACDFAGLDHARVARRVGARQAQITAGRVSWSELSSGGAAAHARAWAREAG